MAGQDRWGVSDGWWATDGGWRSIDDPTREQLQRALGAADHPEGPPAEPPTWFVRPGGRDRLWSPATLVLEDGTTIDHVDELPPDVPLGCHELVPLDGGPTTALFVVPPAAPATRRSWGLSAQLHSARSRDSWGMGDLEDLASLARWTAARGGALLAHNPLGAALPTTVQQPSPYYASTRRFWSPLHLRVEQVPGAGLAGDAVERAARAGRALNGAALIDRDRVWELKRAALWEIWRATGAASRSSDRSDAGADRELERFATFCAIAELHDAGWHRWPRELRHPDRPEVGSWAAANAEAVGFHRWLQVEVDRQLGLAAGVGAGLMADLPVGFDPAGFDAWTDQDLLARGCRVGAPPDDFSPTGQDWGLPPYVPWRLRAERYRPWLDTLRRVLRRSAALRIDHVMGLFRLYWIPEHADATTGGYVHHRGTELLDLAVMEAARAGAVLVGEDLGTVEDEVRDALCERHVLGYRIGWFSDDPPGSWPATTLASLTTHDLPTVAGLWSGQDAADRAHAGLAPDPAGDDLLRSRLARLAGVDPEVAPDHERAVSLAAHAALAASGSDLAVATLEDALGVRSRPNLPGTLDEHPNWRQALPVPIEDLGAAGGDELAAVMATRGPG